MKRPIDRNALRFGVLTILVLAIARPAPGFSVLAHEAIIDSAWDDSIKPVLLKRFPHTTAEQLREAHAYAYGGAIIQDMGYYPFGSKFFTDLVHYVRSGDFVESLLGEAQDVNEYAFALGALAHYVADNSGHAIGVNRAVPVLYPKLRSKYGDRVTYVEDPAAHLKTEFGFDVVQVARGRYRSEDYHDFIGFKVSKLVLERAFKATYGLELKDIFADLDLALGTYRRTASVIIPETTKVAWEMKKNELEKSGMTREKFMYAISRSDYDKEWGTQYEKPGLSDKTLALFLRIVPKVGPFAPLSFKPPTPEAERMFIESFNATLTGYRALLRQARTGRLNLQNRDFDTGQPTRAGEYRLADETYAKLLAQCSNKGFENMTPELRQNILSFYGNLNAPIATKRNKEDWQKTLRALDRLKASGVQAGGQSRSR
jgi:Zinc dependent phospholipase C